MLNNKLPLTRSNFVSSFSFRVQPRFGPCIGSLFLHSASPSCWSLVPPLCLYVCLCGARTRVRITAASEEKRAATRVDHLCASRPPLAVLILSLFADLSVPRIPYLIFRSSLSLSFSCTSRLGEIVTGTAFARAKDGKEFRRSFCVSVSAVFRAGICSKYVLLLLPISGEIAGDKPSCHRIHQTALTLAEPFFSCSYSADALFTL